VKKKFLMFMALIVLIGQVYIGSSYAKGSPNDEGDFKTSLVDGGVEITGYKGTLKDVVIPEFIDQNKVVAIGMEAFNHKNLTSVSIPSGVIIIDGWAFANNQLTSVTIPTSTTTIGKYAFANNELSSIIIPSSTTTIGEGSLLGNRLRIVQFNSALTVHEFSFDYQTTNQDSRFTGWFTDKGHTIEWNKEVIAPMVLYSKWNSPILDSIPETPTSVSLAAKILKAFVLVSFARAAAFNDTAGHWAVSAIRTLHSLDIVQGYSNGNVRPE